MNESSDGRKRQRPGLDGLDVDKLAGLALEDAVADEPSFTQGKRMRILIVLACLAIVALIVHSTSLPKEESLLASVNLEDNLVRGEWSHSHQGIRSSSVETNCLLNIPVKPLTIPYELRWRFTRFSGSDSVALFFKTTLGLGALEIDAWEQPGLSGLQVINGRDLRFGGAFQLTAPPGKSIELNIRVTAETIEIFKDDQLMRDYSLKDSTLRPSLPWAFTPTMLEDIQVALGTWNSEVLFESPILKEIP